MINSVTMTKLYDAVINNEDLTTKTLNDYGFNSTDLTKLVEEKVLERVQRGHYKFIDVEKLFLYGKRLISAKEYIKATECFKKCCNLNQSHIEANMQLFLIECKNNNYEKAFEYFDNFFYTDNAFYNSDNDFYLCLINRIVDIPEKYKKDIPRGAVFVLCHRTCGNAFYAFAVKAVCGRYRYG